MTDAAKREPGLCEPCSNDQHLKCTGRPCDCSCPGGGWYDAPPRPAGDAGEPLLPIEVEAALTDLERARRRRAMSERETMWAIQGRWGDTGKPFLYCGTWLSRKDAIAEYVAGKTFTWRQCRRRGDRVVRVEVRYDAQ